MTGKGVFVEAKWNPAGLKSLTYIFIAERMAHTPTTIQGLPAQGYAGNPAKGIHRDRHEQNAGKSGGRQGAQHEDIIAQTFRFWKARLCR